jgi:hypothetical protein
MFSLIFEKKILLREPVTEFEKKSFVEIIPKFKFLSIIENKYPTISS